MNILRKSVAGLLVSIFFTFSILSFIVFAFNNTFLKKSFYTESLNEIGYEYTVMSSAEILYKNDAFLSRYFTKTDLKREIEKVFSLQIFNMMMVEFADQIDDLKKNDSGKISVSLKLFRESLLTLSHNLAYEVFLSIPKCSNDEIPAEGINNLPTCIISGVNFDLISSSVNVRLDKSIYESIPEQIQFDLSNKKQLESGFSPFLILHNIDVIWMGLYLGLILIIILIALTIYRPFYSIVSYVGVAFLMSGTIGYILSFGFEEIPRIIISTLNNIDTRSPETTNLFNTILNIFSGEVQKISLIFLGVGALLIVIRLFIAKNKKFL